MASTSWPSAAAIVLVVFGCRVKELTVAGKEGSAPLLAAFCSRSRSSTAFAAAASASSWRPRASPVGHSPPRGSAGVILRRRESGCCLAEHLQPISAVFWRSEARVAPSSSQRTDPCGFRLLVMANGALISGARARPPKGDCGPPRIGRALRRPTVRWRVSLFGFVERSRSRPGDVRDCKA